MYTYEIKRNNPHQTSTQADPHDVKDRQRLFNKHFIRFWGDIGSVVAFKRPKKVKQLWVVKYIECDLDKIKWSNDGWTPNYIQLEAEVKRQNGTTETVLCWTCENQLKAIGERYVKASARR